MLTPIAFSDFEIQPLSGRRVVVEFPLELEAGSIAVVFGEPGVGKSWMTLELAVQTSLAGNTALLLVGEGSAGALRHRLVRLYDGRREEQAAERVFLVRGSTLAWGDLMQWACIHRPQLVVVDPLVAYFSGDENNATEVGGLFESLRQLADLGCCVLVVHHSTKRGSGPRGSTAISAAADLVVALNQRADGTLRAASTKVRDGEAYESLFILEIDESRARIVPGPASKGGRSKQSAGARKADVLLDVVGAGGAEGITRNAARITLGISGATLNSLVHQINEGPGVHHISFIGKGRGQRMVVAKRPTSCESSREG